MWSGASPDLRFYGRDLVSGSRPALWKCSCVGDLAAQASGQALIRECESTGSASRSVFPPFINSSATLLFSTLLHLLCLSAACRFVSSSTPLPQDLLRPSFHQREKEASARLSPWQHWLFSSAWISLVHVFRHLNKHQACARACVCVSLSLALCVGVCAFDKLLA